MTDSRDELVNGPWITVDEFQVERMPADKRPLIERKFTTQRIQHRPADEHRAFRHSPRTTTEI